MFIGVRSVPFGVDDSCPNVVGTEVSVPPTGLDEACVCFCWNRGLGRPGFC